MSLHVDKETSFKNIRATALKEFWGDEYDEFVYLWQGSKHNLQFDELRKVPTCENAFSSKEEIADGYQTCVKLYYKFLPLLTKQLNRIHNVSFSTKFWQTAFGLWFFRHICNVYEKHATLKKLDISKVSIVLLNESSFYIPKDHYDYLMCFARDFGIQQLVSQYFYLQGATHQQISKEFEPSDIEAPAKSGLFGVILKKLKTTIKSILHKLNHVNPEIALMGVYFSDDNIKNLVNRSSGRVNSIPLPMVNLKASKPNWTFRNQILEIKAEDEFDIYFLHTLVYCIPNDYLENFASYRKRYEKDIESKRFTHIVSEDWIGNSTTGIYAGLAKEKGRIFINREHGFGSFFYKHDYNFIFFDVADKFLSSGWNKQVLKLVPGGFASRSIRIYQPDSEKHSILYISRTVLLYEVEIIDRNIITPHFFKDLENIEKFMSLLSDNMKMDFILRPRRWNNLCWDTEFLLDLQQRGVKLDSGDFSESIQKPKIIIIDHISTALAEILLTETPFILIYDINSISIIPDLRNLFDEMISCGIIQLNAEDAISHLNDIYDNVMKWWQSSDVQKSFKKLKDVTVAPSSKTVEYLLSLANN